MQNIAFNSINDIIQFPPKVHDWGRGGLTSSGMAPDVFQFMDKVLNNTSKSLEVGLGISTAVFAFKCSKHTCVAPDLNEIKRIKEYCEKNGIPVDNVTFSPKFSYDVWFDLKENSWDLVLIDGGHGFPTPFLDWYFLTQGLNVNGYLIIDDTHISTGKVLKDFLVGEEAWKIVPPYSRKTAIFQKIKEFNYNKEFHEQPQVMKETAAINKYYKYRHGIVVFKIKLRKMLEHNSPKLLKLVVNINAGIKKIFK